MPFSFAHEYPVAFITGAASGIGRELARQLSAQGVAIAAVDRQEEGLRSLEDELRAKGGQIAWAGADVTDAAALNARVAELEARLGPIALVIPSAGVGLETSALSLTAADMAQVLNINLLGVSHTFSAVLPGMLKRRKGHLTALSSLASFRGLPRMLGYCAGKAGLNALMEGLRVEVASYNIHATILCPGWIRTPMTASILAPMPYLMDVDQAAARILWAIRKKKRFYAFPRRLAWRIRFITWLPRAWQDRILRSMLKVK
ncbi:MAG: SDR family NAD(P)-dependent oxidoreductase [Gemmataceae bacterium]